MPTAPLSNGPQVAPGQFSGGTLSVKPPDLSAIGEGMFQLGHGLTKMYQAERQLAEDQQLTQSLSQLREMETADLYDQKEGILQKRGPDLFSTASDRLNSFRERIKGIREGLSSERTKQQFDRASDSIWQGYNRAVQIHLGNERAKTTTVVAEHYVDAETRGSLNMHQRFPQAAFPRMPDGEIDFTSFNDGITRIRAAFQDEANASNTGYPEGREAYAKERTDKAVGALVEQHLDIATAQRDTKTAEAILKNFGHLLPPKSKAPAIRAVEHGMLSDEAQRHADEIQILSYDKDRTLTEQERIANKEISTRFKDDVKMRDEVHRRVTNFFNQENALKRQQDNDLFESYAIRLERGEDFDKLSREKGYWQMPEQGRRMLAQKAAKDTTENIGKQIYLESWAYSDNPELQEKFKAMDLLDPKLGLNVKDIEKLWTLQKQLRRAEMDKAEKAKLDGPRTVHQVSTDALESMGYDKNDDKGREAIYHFKTILSQEVETWERKNNKVATPEDVQKLVDVLKMKVALKGGILGLRTITKPLVDVTAEEANLPTTRIPIEHIPEADKEAIHEMYRIKKKRPASAEEIEREYFKLIQQRRTERGVKTGIKFKE